MAASPAALLPLLVLAVICGVAAGDSSTGSAVDASVHVATQEGTGGAVDASGYVATQQGTAGAGSDSSTGSAVDARVHVATVITVPGVSVPVSFDALRCFSLPRAARKAAGDVQVWWHGLTGGGKGGGRGGGGAACKQLKFFANPACKGKALDEVLQPQFAALRKFFHVPSAKKVARWTSVSCKCEITCQHATCPGNSTCMPTTDSKGVTCACNHGFAAVNGTCVDLCDAVKCGPRGNCTKDANGNPFCTCNTGFKPSNDTLSCTDLCDGVSCGPGGNCTKDANGKPFCTCNTGFKPSNDTLSCTDNCAAVNCGANGKCVRKDNGDPTCQCDAGFQMPPDKLLCVDTACAALGCEPDGVCVTSADGIRSCKWNQSDQVSASSMTFIADHNARGNASKPYTIRLTQPGCTPIPKEVAGIYTFAYSVDNIGGVPGCFYVAFFTDDNCSPSSRTLSRTMSGPMIAMAR
ncbi:unnamed protein product, partial [Closterium sp. Naga37s-1]